MAFEKQTVRVTGKRKPPSDDVVLVVDGIEFGGWKSVRVTRGIERMPSDFQVALTETFPNQRRMGLGAYLDYMTIAPGQSAEVWFGNDRVLTGYIERVMPSISPQSHSVTIAGRSKCADLVDCSALWPSYQIGGSNVLDIATKLAKPYGIEVRSVGDMGPFVPQFNLAPIDNAWSVIEAWCRVMQLIAYDLPDGNLMLLNASTASGMREAPLERAAGGFVEGVNIESAAACWATDHRFSEYRAFTYNVNQFNDLGLPLDSGRSEDRGVGRFRNYAFMVEQGGQLGASLASDRAQWMAARNFGRSGEIALVTDSWRDSAGKLWAPATLVDIDAPSLHKRVSTNDGQPWVIGEVTFSMSANQGTECAIRAMPLTAFAPPPTLPQVVVPAELNRSVPR